MRTFDKRRPVRALYSCGFISLAWVIAAAPAYGDSETNNSSAKESATAETDVLELVVDPAAEPVPAFRYRLLPPPEEQIVGNAAPIYSRIVHEQSDAWKQRLHDEVYRLNKLPLDELPLDESQKLLESFNWVLAQLESAAQRSNADWQYVFEGQDPLLIRLPDAQFMRAYARLLLLKVRTEIRAGNLPGAVHAAQIGMALGQHVADAPFIVSQLIGLAVSEMMVAELDSFVARPDAPNLYWALATLPRPLMSFAPGLQTERRTLLLKFPELAELDKLRTDEQWLELATALRKWSVELVAMEQGVQGVNKLVLNHNPAKNPKLEQAKSFLQMRLNMPAKQVESMSDAEVEVRYCVALYDDIADNWQKWFFLPYPQALPDSGKRRDALEAEARLRELYPLVSVLTPLSSNLLLAPARLDRTVARLQAIEALRMHAAAAGSLPETLEEVTVVPVPNDPATGAPFRYTLEGDVAVLDLADEMGMKREQVNMPVRIRLRENE